MGVPGEDLAARSCVPCRKGTPPLDAAAVAALLPRIQGWEVKGEKRIEKTFKFADFRTALSFVNLVGEEAEAQNHHPSLHLSWGKVRVEIWTHAAGGLTESDFVLAAKVDRIPS